MAILFQDLFNGAAGSPEGRTPDTGFNSITWDSTSNATLDGSGALMSTLTTPEGPAGAGYTAYGIPGNANNYGLGESVTLVFNFTTKAGAVYSSGNGHNGVRVFVRIGGVDFEVNIKVFPSEAQWYAVLRNGGDYITLAPNSTYTVTCVFADGNQSMNIAGVDIYDTAAYNNANGFSFIDATVGSNMQLHDLTVSDTEFGAPNTVTAYIASEPGTLSTRPASSAYLASRPGTLYARGRSLAGVREFNGVSQPGTLSARTGAVARMASQPGTLVASITVPISVRANLASQPGTLAASATVAVSMRADLRMSSKGTITAYAGAVAALASKPGTLSAVATAGVLARFAGGSSLGTLQATMTTGIVVNARLASEPMAPAPSMRAELDSEPGRLFATAHVVVVTEYEAYAVNLQPGNRVGIHEVTRYTNFPFHGVVRYQGSYFGWGADGLSLLDGTTDEGDAAIDWAWNTALTDFQSSRAKNVHAGVIRGRIGPAVTASVSVAEAADTAYPATIVRGQNAQNHRIKFGRGLDGVFYSFGLAGTGEGAVSEVEFDATELKRRI